MSMKIFEWPELSRKEFLINAFNIDGAYSYPLHSHQNHWELVYCREGEFLHQINGKSYKQREGELIFVREKDIHLLKGKNFHYYNISFSSAWLDLFRSAGTESLVESLIDFDSDPPYYTVPLQERSLVIRKIESLLGRERDERSNLHFSTLLHLLVEMYFSNVDGKHYNPDWPDWFKRLITFIENETEVIPDLPELVEYSCKCAEHVSRTFRKCLGQSPTNYLKELKMKRAGELLESTNYPIKEICSFCSYENSNYFHKQFREHYNCTPGEYRKLKSRRIH